MLSDVSLAYSSNLANLEKAKRIFEGEMTQFNQQVLQYVEDASSKMNADLESGGYLNWQKPVDNSSGKSTWLDFSRSLELCMNVRPFNQKNKKINVASLSFRIEFEAQKKSIFVFTCYFENQNTLDEQLDEKLFDIIKRSPDKFPEAFQIKSDRTIFFQIEISKDLLANYRIHVDNILDACRQLIKDDQVKKNTAQSILTAS